MLSSSNGLVIALTYMTNTTYFAQKGKSEIVKVGIKHNDRRLHTHIIGKTGTGKSTLLKNLIIQDIQNGQGVAVIDPHGDLVEDILDYIPSHRTGDLVYFNPSDHDHPIGFNILEPVEPHKRSLIASHVVSIFKSFWDDSWGPRLEYILYNSVLSLLDFEQSTLLMIPRLLTDQDFRHRIVSKIQNPVLKNFWLYEYECYNNNFRQEAIAPIQNKVGQFLTDTTVRNIVGQIKSKIDMSFLMDNQRILLCNLSKGEIGEDKTALLGSLIVAKIYLSALKRSKQPESQRKDFYLYIDETQNITTKVLNSIYSETRKYRLNLITSNQYLFQLSPSIKEGILGNVGTLMCFRLGSSDALELHKEFAGGTIDGYNHRDLEELGRHEICLKVAEDGITSKPFTATALPPIRQTTKSNMA